jgi:hypothetical protein
MSPYDVLDVIKDREDCYKRTRFCVNNVAKRRLDTDVLDAVLVGEIKTPIPGQLVTMSGVTSDPYRSHFTIRNVDLLPARDPVKQVCAEVLKLLPAVKVMSGHIMRLLPSVEELRQLYICLVKQKLLDEFSLLDVHMRRVNGWTMLKQ